MTNQQIIDNILKYEIHFHFSKSWWHGWQKVNKKNTKAELFFNIHDSNFLSDDQKKSLIQVAGHRVHHHEGILILTDKEERLQYQNKKKVTKHFIILLNEALNMPIRNNLLF
jgi:ribosome-associated protein